MKTESFLDLWKKDGYKLSLEWTEWTSDRHIWQLYTTQFKYIPYEYRRHFGILLESEESCDVFGTFDLLRFRELVYDRRLPVTQQLEDMINTAKNIYAMNWKTPEVGEGKRGIQEFVDY